MPRTSRAIFFQNFVRHHEDVATGLESAGGAPGAVGGVFVLGGPGAPQRLHSDVLRGAPIGGRKVAEGAGAALTPSLGCSSLGHRVEAPHEGFLVAFDGHGQGFPAKSGGVVGFRDVRRATCQ